MLYFFAMIAMNFYATNWIMELVYKSAGITKRELKRYRRNHVGGSRRELYAALWIISRSPEPERTRKLIRFHQLVMAPAALGVFFALGSIVFSLQEPEIHNAILIGAAVLIPVYNIIIALVGRFYKDKISERIPEKRPPEEEEYDPWEDDYDLEEALDEYNPEEPAAYDSSGGTDEQFSPEVAEWLRRSHRRRKIFSVTVAVIALLIISATAFWPHPDEQQEPPESSSAEILQTGETKIPPTVEHLINTLVSKGFSPQDVTEQDIVREYDRCIVVQEDDFFLDFYVYPDESGAKHLYESVKAQQAALIQGDSSVTEEAGVNYNLYKALANGRIYITARVGETTLCVECSDEKKGILKELFAEFF
jgi:hypothetical protein